ncbi:MAG: glycoside hydrolase family 127 protein, partial [Asticcacaulis sp.]|nr:glycoside hydrolase family 127 protein [Asticcacaulis sp.]
ALLAGAGALTALPVVAHATTPIDKVEPFPLEAVTLTPSIWRSAVDRNAVYLKSLEPDRFLHNFRVSAGLPPRGAVYGGWEAMGIAGHSLGHYLSACGLAYAQTKDPEFKHRLDYMAGELAAIQAAHGDGYVGGTTVERDGKVVDGKVVFEEVKAHNITTHGFDVNGGWVPLYTWHKVHAGLLDAHRYGNNPQALKVAAGMSDYLIGVFGGLSDDELQQVLAAEHGGLNETFAETYVRTGDKRYLDMARRIYHKAILTPLSERRDELEGKHANTQIPKLIGLARLYEVTGDKSYGDTAGFFWDRVVHHHSYVIGGNSDSEHFGAPDKLSPRIDDKTCEACNSYNMLKLTRHLYQWQPDAAWFDYYERTHLNHIMAHQDPDTGLFVYFMPLSSGSQRIYSTPTNSFWCCVGSGMESHSKHGDSIYWRQGERLFVNLFIPSELNWTVKKTKLAMTGDIVAGEPITLTVAAPAEFTLAMRIPAWADKPGITVNGQAQPMLVKDGYVRLARRWKAGDTVVVTLPQIVQVVTMADNPKMAAFVKGPVVLAADMGEPAGDVPPAPVVVAADALSAVDGMTLKAEPQNLALKPFFSQYKRRTAVYFPLFSDSEWQVQKTAYEAEQAAKRALDARTIDVMRLGEMQPERDHAFATDIAEVSSRVGRPGRWIMWTTGKYFEFDLGVDPAGTVMQVTYWGQDVYRNFDIFIDGKLLVNEKLALAPVDGFREVDYALPATTASKVRVRFVTRGSTVDVFEVRTLKAASPHAQQAT